MFYLRGIHRLSWPGYHLHTFYTGVSFCISSIWLCFGFSVRGSGEWVSCPSSRNTHTHTHGEMCVCAERERERVRERRGNQRAERKKVSQPAASEENGDHAGWMPPLVDAANALNFFSLTVGFLFHSVALYTSMRYGCFCAVFVLRRPFVCVELA